MKILFAIQGTGNGHISRAREIIPYLQQYGELDILVSGTQADVSLPQQLAYRKRGLSYVFGKRGGIDYLSTLKGLSPLSLLKDIISFPVHKYDLIINDFEPVTAWAAKLKGKPVIALSHQSAYLSKYTPRPLKKDRFAEGILKYYAPCTHAIAFHFESYDDFIYTPVIRSEIRELQPVNDGHYTVYLPAYDDKILAEHLASVPGVKWEVFSKHQKSAYQFGNIHVCPIDNVAYNKSLASCEGLLTGGGFEAPAEALYLGKKVMVIPMKGQYEQYCNAEGLKRLGVPVVYEIDEQFHGSLDSWISAAQPVPVNFPDKTAEIIKMLFSKYGK